MFIATWVLVAGFIFYLWRGAERNIEETKLHQRIEELEEEVRDLEDKVEELED